ncbi:MAG: efflux RND transporter periplasmic adaptor subunit, partial [Desulfovibrionaceae bacterium]|nr:efflux RND transporter periplasmic adaptor subunit [Desulfovibrionaceae bacterium]
MDISRFFQQKGKSGKFKLILLFLVAIAAALTAALCRGPEQVDYLTEFVRRGNIEQKVTATGQVSAVQLVDVGAQVSGQIEKLYVHLGQEVKRGDMVADIDSTTQENDLAINRAKLETYQAQLNSREIALKIAKTQYERERRLKNRDATSSEKLEDARNELAAAEAAVIEMESLIKQTQIAVNTSEVNLGYTRISAPLDGVVVSLAVEAGQTVNANQTTPTIVQIADLSEMEIKIEISEGDVTKVKPGMPVSFTILSEPDQVYETTLKSIDPGLTTLTDGTYTGTTDT